MDLLSRAARAIDKFNQGLGMSVAWMAIFMVAIQFIVVVLRYIFGYGSIFMQETIIYLHGFLFMLGASYTLLHNGHVRVDVFYREASPRTKARIDLFGVIFFLIPVCVATFFYAWPYVAQAWENLESSKETSGIPAVYVLKTSILVFAVLIILQGISLAIHSVLVLTGREAPAGEAGREGV